MKNSKIIYGILLVSLALNLFLAGVFVTQILRPHPPRPFGPPERFNLEAARDAVGDDYQLIVDEIWGDFKDGQKTRFRDVLRLRQKTQELLLAEEFDAAAFEALSLRAYQTGDQMREEMLNAMIELGSTLPATERQNYFRAGFDFNHRGPPGRPPRRLGRDDNSRD